MAEDKSRHLRAFADFLGKEFYAVDYDAASGLFRLLAPPNTGLEPLAHYRVFTVDEDAARMSGPSDETQTLGQTWNYLGTDFRIYGPVPVSA